MFVHVDTGLGDVDFDGIGFAWGAAMDFEVSDSLTMRPGYEFTKGDLEHEDCSSIEVDTELSQQLPGLHYRF